MRFFVIFVLMIVMACPKSAQTTQQDVQSAITQSRRTAITRAIEEVSPAVVGVNVTKIKSYTTSPFRDPLFDMFFGDTYNKKVENLGSGFLVSADGFILTNAHVAENATEIVITMSGGKKQYAKVIGIDTVTDLALLKIDIKDVHFVHLGNSDDIIPGEWVIALGNPFGLFDVSYQPTATVGIVSGLHLDFGEQPNRGRYQDMIQTDASINSGNSGGPLVNANGEVIGINTFIFKASDYNEGSIGIGFAIPINRVKRIMEDLKKHGKIDWSFNTGLKIQEIDADIAKAFDLPVSYGILVTGVDEGSPGEKAGIVVGDIITDAQGEPVRNGRDIRSAIQNSYLHAGDILNLQVWRKGKQRTMKLKLEPYR